MQVHYNTPKDTMSDNLAEIDAQTSAIHEKLYDKEGQPDELDKAFIQKHFKQVQENLNLDFKGLLGPYETDAKLSQTDKGLIDVYIYLSRTRNCCLKATGW